MPHPSVCLEEYVYFGQEMAKCTNGNPYLLIIDGIVDFLSKGRYEDKTGIARKNQSPIITESEDSHRQIVTEERNLGAEQPCSRHE